MHPARAKAQQVQALVETAESVASLVERLDRIEAKLDQVLAAAPAAAPASSTPAAKSPREK